MRIPTTTYRFQLNREFTLADAQAALPYLEQLGITDLYASPISHARPGSGHGYDVLDHTQVNPEIGGEAALASLGADLKARGMGFVLDIVPNHMCVAGDGNARWMDVLENGPSAASARFFDIDWNPPKPELVAKVLLPILPDQFGRVVESGELTVHYRPSGFAVAYGGSQLPLAPKSWVRILTPALAQLATAIGGETTDVLELESILRALHQLPARTDTAPARLRERRHELPIIKARLATLHERSADFRKALADTLEQLVGDKDEPQSFAPLSALLTDQAFRLSSWRVASHEINYRRFFDINDLGAIKVEDPVVFAAVHALPLRLVEQGLVTGLRIDHVDGLHDPVRYLRDLQHAWAESTRTQAAISNGEVTAPESAAVADPRGEQTGYVVVEKILGHDEKLPVNWPVAGTTGYEFMNLCTGILVDEKGLASLQQQSRNLTGEVRPFAEIAYDCKKLILESSLAAELTVLARRLDRISEQHVYTRDFTRISLQEALTEVIACFPVYRTYVRSDHEIVGNPDRAMIEHAMKEARRRNPVIHETVFDFVRAVLLLEDPPAIDDVQKAERRHFVMRFQQLTSPVMAKGIEDTAFYRYFPLAALDEVGGHPESADTSVGAFHRQLADRAAALPHSLCATDTHDAKRSEDVRARLCVLSELAPDWERAVAQWRELNRGLVTQLPHHAAPDAADEYLFYQSLIGVWPFGVEIPNGELPRRLAEYMRKAIHEAKRHTSWINPSRAYDEAVDAFVAGALDPKRSRPFLTSAAAFVRRIENAGLWNALSQTVIKIAAPGVPDFYQGTESWAFNLVDPDNRRPIDFSRRAKTLGELLGQAESDPVGIWRDLFASPGDGRLKLLVTARALRHRRAQRELFCNGNYEPNEITGARKDEAIAFSRCVREGGRGRAAVAVVGRFFTRLHTAAGTAPVGKCWEKTEVVLPKGFSGHNAREIFTGRTLATQTRGERTVVALDEIFAHLPVALLDLTEACDSVARRG